MEVIKGDVCEHYVRLLKFIPGKTMEQTPLTRELLYNFGTYIGNLR